MPFDPKIDVQPPERSAIEREIGTPLKRGISLFWNWLTDPSEEQRSALAFVHDEEVRVGEEEEDETAHVPPVFQPEAPTMPARTTKAQPNAVPCELCEGRGAVIDAATGKPVLCRC